VFVCGEGEAGLWALLAAPAFDGVVADVEGFDGRAPDRWMQPEVFVPGILRIGGLDAVASLAAPKPVVIHHAPPAFSTDWLKQAFASAAASDHLRVSPGALSREDQAAALAGF